MNFNQILKAVSYRIAEGSQCLIPGLKHCRYVDFFDVHGKNCASVLIDQDKVLLLSIENTDKQICYRWMDVSIVETMKAHSKAVGYDYNCAWDDVKYTELEVEEDALEKLLAIAHDMPYDKKIMIELDLDVDLMLRIEDLAISSGMSFQEFINDLCEKSLIQFIERKKQENATQELLGDKNEHVVGDGYKEKLNVEVDKPQELNDLKFFQGQDFLEKDKKFTNCK